MIAADTVINATPGHCEILNKPRNADQAEHMLNMLNNKEHQVLTAVHVIFRKNNGQVDERHFVESTLVKFSDIDPGLMKACKSENPFWYPEFILVAWLQISHQVNHLTRRVDMEFKDRLPCLLKRLMGIILM